MTKKQGFRNKQKIDDMIVGNDIYCNPPEEAKSCIKWKGPQYADMTKECKRTLLSTQADERNELAFISRSR